MQNSKILICLLKHLRTNGQGYVKKIKGGSQRSQKGLGRSQMIQSEVRALKYMTFDQAQQSYPNSDVWKKEKRRTQNK